MNNYTVILIAPDTLAEQYGDDFHIARVEADSAQEAFEKARIEGVHAFLDEGDEPDEEEIKQYAEGFGLVAIFDGWPDELAEFVN